MAKRASHQARPSHNAALRHQVCRDMGRGRGLQEATLKDKRNLVRKGRDRTIKEEPQ